MAKPSLGPVMTPLDTAELTSRLTCAPRPWRQVDVHESVDSTNDRAALLAGSDGRPWRLVAADRQTGGHGRLGRSWLSPSGTSISMSMVVPAGPSPAALGWLPLLTGLAVSRALGRLTGRPEAFALKWPNDVLALPLRAGDEQPGPVGEAFAQDAEWPMAEGRPSHKVCGILCQSLAGAGAGLAVVGIGVNVSVPPAELPVPHATSIAECCPGTTPAREDLIVGIADEFAWWHGKFEAGADGLGEVRSAYSVACATIGCDVRVHLPGRRALRGRAQRVDSDGRLVVLEQQAGGLHTLAAGDVVHIRGGG